MTLATDIILSTAPDGEPTPIVKGSNVYLIDGSGYIFRAFHALPPLTRPSDGLPVGAVHGFCAMLWKLLSETKLSERPTHIACIFDAGAVTFRNTISADYKAHRPPPPEELVPQFALIRDAVRAFNVACVEQDGFEADDLIATYTKDAVAQGADVMIVSSDKDLMQIVGPCVSMLDTMKNKRFGREEVIEKFGVPPEKVIDVQSLAGDSVDNVPGVPGIGIKTAAAVIREVGDLDRVLGSGGDDLEVEFGDLVERFRETQEEIDAIAGVSVKLNSSSQIAEILISKLGVASRELKLDKAGKPTADTAVIELLATQGNEFCKKVVRAREIKSVFSSHIAKIRKFADQARLSRELVTLKSDVAVEIPLDRLGVQDPDPETLLGFLRLMEFSTLTRRIATALGADAGALPEMSVGSTVAKTPPASLAPAPAATGDAAPQTAVAYAAKLARENQLDRSKVEIVSTPAALAKWIAKIRDAGRTAVHVMLSGPDAMRAELVGVALAPRQGEACYVPLAHQAGEGGLDLSGEMPPQIPVRDALTALKPLLEDASILKIGHDLKPAAVALLNHGVTLSPTDDTLVMSYALDGGKHGHPLADLAERHLNHACVTLAQALAHAPAAKKADRRIEQAPVQVVAELAGETADVTLRLWTMFRPRLAAERVTRVYEVIDRPLTGVLAEVERHGVKVDRAALSRLSGRFSQDIARLEAEIFEQAGGTFNLGSPRQMGELLFDKLKLPGGRRTKTGQWETRAGTLDDLAANEELPPDARRLVETMLEWRQLNKLKTTYTDSLPDYINPATGRIHTTFALAHTTTGRIASLDPNLQNIPIRTKQGRDIRAAFIAEPGNKLISADYGQIELRILAHIADIPQLKQAFADGLDIHAMTASEMFGVPVQGMPAETRRRAKAINFGIVYGISAFGLSNQLGIPREEAALYIKTYFERFPGIRDYMEATKAFCREHGYVLTLHGRKVHYPEINTKNPGARGNFERAAINAPIQGSGADIIRRAMIRMPRALLEAGLSSVRMLLQVHDELLFEAPETDVERTLPVVTKVMADAAMPAVSLSVPLQVEAKAADNWEAAH